MSLTGHHGRRSCMRKSPSTHRRPHSPGRPPLLVYSTATIEDWGGCIRKKQNKGWITAILSNQVGLAFHAALQLTQASDFERLSQDNEAAGVVQAKLEFIIQDTKQPDVPGKFLVRHDMARTQSKQALLVCVCPLPSY